MLVSPLLLAPESLLSLSVPTLGETMAGNRDARTWGQNAAGRARDPCTQIDNNNFPIPFMVCRSTNALRSLIEGNRVPENLNLFVARCNTWKVENYGTFTGC